MLSALCYDVAPWPLRRRMVSLVGLTSALKWQGSKPLASIINRQRTWKSNGSGRFATKEGFPSRRRVDEGWRRRFYCVGRKNTRSSKASNFWCLMCVFFSLFLFVFCLLVSSFLLAIELWFFVLFLFLFFVTSVYLFVTSFCFVFWFFFLCVCFIVMRFLNFFSLKSRASGFCW